MEIAPGLSKAFRLVSEGRLPDLKQKLAAHFARGLQSREVWIGLRRDLTRPFPAPNAKIPLAIREATPEDGAILFPSDLSGQAPADRAEVLWRRQVFAAGVRTCYVAVDARNGRPCYCQWLMSRDQNDEIRSISPFPPLEAGEALLENAYTPPEYRGFGIMSAAMALIAERGSERDARAVLTYVREDNVASLKGCQRAGFASYSKLENRWYAFGLVKEIDHAFLPDSFRLPHERLAA
jgi:RimJ/RimL family protein N-acetyltransferase